VTRRPPKAENPGAIVHLAGRTPEQAERELIYMALIDLRNEVGLIKQMVQRLATVREPEQPARHALPPAPADPVEALARNGELRLDEMERRMIVAALKRFEGNRRLAAEALGIAERTLYRKLKEYALEEGEDESAESAARPDDAP
jgi:DNA-binding NtrC family response regulator